MNERCIAKKPDCFTANILPKLYFITAQIDKCVELIPLKVCRWTDCLFPTIIVKTIICWATKVPFLANWYHGIVLVEPIELFFVSLVHICKSQKRLLYVWREGIVL